MKRILMVLAPFVAAAALAPSTATAQSADIQQALLAAPAGLKDDATVIRLNPDGSSATVRQGHNGLMCWVPVDGGRWTSMCTAEGNRARVEQNHEFNAMGGSKDEIQARFAQAEKNGTRALSKPGTFYYHGMGDSPSNVRVHMTIVVPNATSQSLGGIPTERQPAGLWLMQGGTSSAHLMLPDLPVSAPEGHHM